MSDWMLESIVRCPTCCTPGRMKDKQPESLLCESCGTEYPALRGRPILFSRDNQVFRIEDYREACLKRSKKDISRIIPSPSVNLSRRRILRDLKRILAEEKRQAVLVIGAGNQRANLDEAIKTGELPRIVYTDIDVNAGVDLFCDGQDLPFVDASFDAVVTTAVLEHVLYPEQAAKEIQRVLKVGGLLYSEIPFMQQVHEGAYDFTRYTLSGHKRLFNFICVIESGMVAGPATSLVWAIENFLLAFSSRAKSRQLLKVSSRIVFGWIKYVDLLLSRKAQAIDGASCTFVFGRMSDTKVSDKEIIETYVGAKHIEHA